MTLKVRVDQFILQCKKDFGRLTWEFELLLRYGYSAGARDMGHVAYNGGIDERQHMLSIFGAQPQKGQRLP